MPQELIMLLLLLLLKHILNVVLFKKENNTEQKNVKKGFLGEENVGMNIHGEIEDIMHLN